MPEDYGEPIYVEAHGGKNNVILYRSKADPNLAVEFFFRSCSKDGRSRYYRCTKCWYLYKTNRGTCATLIVRDGRIITDPENPVVPHQCNFRPLEAVAANRAWIAGRKRRPNLGILSSASPNSSDSKSSKTNEDQKVAFDGFCAPINDDAVSLSSSSYSPDKNSNCAGLDSDSKKPLSPGDCAMASPSAASHASTDSVDSANNFGNSESAAYSQTSSASDCFTPCTSRSNEFIELINTAFSDSMQKRSDDALEKLRQAIEMKEAFEIDDVSLIDNVYSAQIAKESDERKMVLCEDWINMLAKIPPTANARWMTHYQFSIYYCFHLIAILTRRLCNLTEKKRFFDLSQEVFKGLLSLTCNIHESTEEVTSTKLDILLSLSFICTQYFDVCETEAATFVETELNNIKETFSGNYPPDVAAMMVQKVCRIENNLEEFKWSTARK